MSAKQCPACGGLVSTAANACPHCGQPTSAGTVNTIADVFKALGAILMLIPFAIVGVVILWAVAC